MSSAPSPSRFAATRALLAKELAQHRRALAGVSGLLGLSWLLARLSLELTSRRLTDFELVSAFAGLPLGGAALYLGHRLVVAEYLGRTQRFVEALPVRRGHLTLVKAAFGLGWIWAWALGALLATAALTSEPVGGRFLALLAARLLGAGLALWGAVFLLGHCGRLRLPLGLGVAGLLWLIDRQTAWQLERFGPFLLLASDSFGLERQVLPLRALAEATLLGLGAFAAAYALGRVREGSVVESLSRPLSPREVSAALLLGIGGLTALAALEPEAAPAPFTLTTDRRLRAGGGALEIGYLEDGARPAAERLAAALTPTLAALGPALGLSLPPVLVVHAPDVHPERPDTARLHPREGLVLRVNLTALAAGDHTDTVAQVVHQLIWARTGGRAGLEPRHFLLDGFALHFAQHGAARSPTRAGAAADAPDATWLAAALAAELLPLEATALRGYTATSERLGDALVQALAATGWRVLEGRVGRARALTLARALFTRPGTGDLRDALHEWRNPLPELLERTTGLDYGQLLSDWRAALARVRGTPAGQALLRTLPRGGPRATADPIAGIALSGAAAPAPAADLPCQLRHGRLPPFDVPFDPDDFQESDLVWPAGAPRPDHQVTGEYGPGERALVALDCRLPGLPVPLRLLAARVTVP